MLLNQLMISSFKKNVSLIFYLFVFTSRDGKILNGWNICLTKCYFLFELMQRPNKNKILKILFCFYL